MNSALSQETIDNLQHLALQRIQSDIASDRMWMQYNPYIALACLGIVVACLIVILVNEFVAFRVERYIDNTRFGLNFGAIAIGILAGLGGTLFAIGYFLASADYNFKTLSPDAAAYQIVVSYLYGGAS